MSVKDDLKAARKAQEKLDTYCKGLPKGSNETRKYLELNSAVNKALGKLPKGLRSYAAVDILGRQTKDIVVSESDKYGSNKKDKLSGNSGKSKSTGSKTGNSAKNREIDPEDKGR